MSKVAPIKFVPPQSTRKRRVNVIRFSHPVHIKDLGHMRELVDGSKLTADRPGGRGVGTPVPELWYLADEQTLLVGTQRFHVANNVIESYDLGE